jgi:hypothetical protein
MSGPLTVGAALSGTPLEREHQRFLTQRRPRPILPIPWRRFARERYSEEALRVAAQLQHDLAVGELLAVNSFSRIAAALAMVGAPLDLVGATARVSTDEVRHADYNLRMLALLEGRPAGEAAAHISPRELEAREEAYRGRPTTLDELDEWMLEVPVLGETLACALLFECARVATDPVARALFRSVVADEVHHARLGWYYLTWRRSSWSATARARLARRAAALVESARTRFARGRDVATSVAPFARALGVLDTPTQQAAVERVITDELAPGIAALGLSPIGAGRAPSSGRG